MIKTKFERVDVGSPDIAAFKIEGKLGFHENGKIQRLVEECLKRDLRTVIFDFSELTSLGGGVAKILRDFVEAIEAKGGRVSFVVTSDIVMQFLQTGAKSVSIYRSFAEALAVPTGSSAPVDDAAATAPPQSAQASGVSSERGAGVEAEPSASFAEGTAAAPGPQADASAGGKSPAVDSSVIFMSYDDGGSGRRPAAPRESAPAKQGGALAAAMHEAWEADSTPTTSGAQPQAAEAEEEPRGVSGDASFDGEAEEIISEIFGAGSSESSPECVEAPAAAPRGAMPQLKEKDGAVGNLNRQLKRRILELNTLFSISADFNATWDRKKLLDIFLLTAIAQGGVEAAVFLENRGESFTPIMSKGLEPEALMRLEVATKAVARVTGENNVIPVDAFAMEQACKESIKREGIEYVCPFRTKDGLSGLVLLGRRIAGRGMKEEDFEFLRILVNIAQGAFDNAVMLEREHERTLGIVKTLISIIEENTLLKGTSEIVSRYVGMVAKNMDYSEENFKDLIYGTVLRDMGMVKVSDLILRSPRDLTKEEWEIIKKHPEDGGEMLARMKFSNHVVSIVKTHHERFNGEGYPYGLRGKEIPLGARIISVVESYAAMIHERPTRPALSEREAIDTLKENYGMRYDREVVMQFARIMEKEMAQSVQQGISVP